MGKLTGERLAEIREHDARDWKNTAQAVIDRRDLLEHIDDQFADLARAANEILRLRSELSKTDSYAAIFIGTAAEVIEWLHSPDYDDIHRVRRVKPQTGGANAR